MIWNKFINQNTTDYVSDYRITETGKICFYSYPYFTQIVMGFFTIMVHIKIVKSPPQALSKGLPNF